MTFTNLKMKLTNLKLIRIVCTWWTTLPYADPAMMLQARLWQTIASSALLSSFVHIPTAIVTLHSLIQYVAITWTFGSAAIGFSRAWWWVRHGNMLRCAQWLCASALVSFLPAFALYGLSNTGTILPVLVFPIIWAGLSQDRRTLIFTMVMLVGGLYLAYILEHTHWKYAGLLSIRTLNTSDGVGVPIVLFITFAVLINAYGNLVNRQAQLLRQQGQLVDQRNKELEASNETLEDRVRERTAQLAEQTRLHSESARSNAHDLRDCLADCNSHVFVLQKYLPLDNPIVAQHNDLLQKALTGGRQLVDSIMAASKLTSDALELDFHSIQFDAILSTIITEINWRFTANECTYSIHHEPCPYWIDADMQAVQRILRNLFINGLKAVANVDNGHVDISITQDTEHNTTCLTIQDNGCGIEPELLQRLAIPFTTKNGTGLGLHYCKGVMVKHPLGSFHIYSAGVHCGATVILTFRTASAPENSAPEPAVEEVALTHHL